MTAAGATSSGATTGCGGCQRCARRLTLWIIVINIVLGVFKVATGTFANSAAIWVDGIQSFACAVVAILVAAGIRLGNRPATAAHPYGYGKAEFLVSVISYSGLLGLALCILASSTYLLIAGRSDPPMLLALPVALISAYANYLLYASCRCAAAATQSAGLKANAGQNYADMVSSCAVAASVALCQIGPSFYFFDAVAAMLASIMIIVDAAACWRADMRVLLDSATEQGQLDRARRVARSSGGVRGVSFIRGRCIGKGVALVLGVDLPGTTSVAEAHQIALAVRGDLLRQLPWVSSAEVYPCASAVDAGAPSPHADPEQSSGHPGNQSPEQPRPLITGR